MTFKKSMAAVFASSALTFACIANTALAAEDKTPGSGPNPFSECGIGAALFPNTAWAAVTSNVIWDVGTTAVTSATASPETCSGKKLEVAKFINETYDSLVVETAVGEGEHVTAMLEIFGCTRAAQPAIVSEIRSSLGQQVGSPEYLTQDHIEKASSYYQALTAVIQAGHAPSCSA